MLTWLYIVALLLLIAVAGMTIYEIVDCGKIIRTINKWRKEEEALR